MNKKLFTIAGVFLLMACLSGFAFGQAQPIAQGAINVLSTDCAAATANGCVILQFPAGTAGVAVQITQTFSATLQFEATVNGVTWAAIAGTPQAGGTSVTSATSTGTWQFGVSGLIALRVRASGYVSGQAGVIIQASSGASPTNNTGISVTTTCTSSTCTVTAVQPTGSNLHTAVDSLPAAEGPQLAAASNPVVLSYEPQGQGVSTIAMSGTASTQVIPGLASNYLYIQRCTFSNDSTTVSTREALQDDSGGATIDMVPNPAATVATTGGGGSTIYYGMPGLHVPTIAHGLFVANVTTGSATTVSCNGTYSPNKYF